MEAGDFRFGFVVAGPPSSDRVLCRRAEVYAQAVEGDGTPEGYLSLWTFPRQLPEYVLSTGSTAGYPGPVWAPWLALDIDGPGGTVASAVGPALVEVKQLLCWLETACAADLRHVQLHFSGGKGFHLELPLSGVVNGPEAQFHRVAKAFVERVAIEADVRYVDGAIYDKARLLRLPNSRHGRTGLYKVPVPAEEALKLPPERVLALAQAPIPAEAPAPDAGTWCDWTLSGLWAEARAQVERSAAVAVPGGAKDRLNPQTQDYLRHGAPEGQRAVRLFAACANLAELGAPLPLCRALLREVALDTGLPQAEVDGQLTKGFEHGRARA